MAKAKAAPAAPVAQEEEVASSGEQELGEAAMFEGTGEEGFVIDLSQDDENKAGFPILPRGMYPAIVDDCTFSLSQNSGNPMWTLVFEIESGDFAGQKQFFHLPFTPKMRSRIKRFLVRVAPELANAPFDPKEVADSGQLVGKRAQLRIDIREYNKKDRNNVRDVLPPSDDTGAGSNFLGS